MNNNSYVIDSVKNWHKNEFHKIKKKLKGDWYLIENHKELTLENIEKNKP